MEVTEINWKKNTAVFIASQGISILGSSLVQFAITWYITLTTQSGIYATLIIVCGFLPTFFLSPFAGVWADRYNRKVLIIIADAGIAICTLILAIFFLLGYDAVWLLFVAAGIRALGSAIQNPCVNAMLPDIVPEEHLTRVNGLNGSIQSFIMLISPMISGALMGITTIEKIFFIDVITAAFAIFVMLLFFKLSKKEKPQNEDLNYFTELKEGITYIWKEKYLRSFFVFCAFFYVLSAPVAFLTPLQTARVFGDDVWRLTAIELVFSVGMMCGGLIMAVWGGLKNRIYTMVLSGVIMSITVVAMGFPYNFWIYILFMGLCGLVMPFFNTPAIVLLQEKVDSNYIGRVFGIMSMLSSSLMPIAMLVYGPIADILPIEWLLISTGFFMIILSVSMLFNRSLLKAGKR